MSKPNTTRLDELVELHGTKYHLIHTIKSALLFNKSLSETMESLERLTLDELFWLFEQMTLRNKYEEAYYKDEKHQEDLNK